MIEHIARFLGKLVMRPFWWGLRLAGWRVEGQLPDIDKYVVIGAPHTSNWDYFIFLGLVAYFGVRPLLAAKSEIMRGPIGWFIRLFGGFGVDRHAPHNVVQQLIGEIQRRKRVIFVLSPEGTRKRTEYWRSGFYHVALGAKIPLMMGAINWQEKVVYLSEPFMLTGDSEADMAHIRAFYEGRSVGKFPENFGPIRLREHIQTSTEEK